MIENGDWVKAVLRTALYSSWVAGAAIALISVLIMGAAWAIQENAIVVDCSNIMLCGRGISNIVLVAAAVIIGGIPIMVAAAVYSVFLSFPCALLAGIFMAHLSRKNDRFWFTGWWILIGAAVGLFYWLLLDYNGILFFVGDRPPLGYSPAILLFPILGGVAAALVFRRRMWAETLALSKHRHYD